MKTRKEWIELGYIPITKVPKWQKIANLTASKECLEVRGSNPPQCDGKCLACEWCMVKKAEDGSWDTEIERMYWEEI